MMTTSSFVAVALVVLAGLGQAKNIPINWKGPLASNSISATCGDKLVFTFKSNTASVVQISNRSCEGTTIREYGRSSPITVGLSKAGTTYYTSKCSPSHCKEHNQLLTVTTTCGAPVTHVLTTQTGHEEWSDEYGAYATIHAKCGDKLRFKWAGDEHDIVQFSSLANYKACQFIGATLWSIHHEDWDTTITLTKAGTTYYGCTVHDHCKVGMKVAVVTTC